jgi:hypothetical protein
MMPIGGAQFLAVPLFLVKTQAHSPSIEVGGDDPAGRDGDKWANEIRRRLKQGAKFFHYRIRLFRDTLLLHFCFESLGFVGRVEPRGRRYGGMARQKKR